MQFALSTTSWFAKSVINQHDILTTSITKNSININTSTGVI
jgi:hypothetical protein